MMLKNKYVYFIPCGGLNDCFTNINKIIQYCKKYKRILLLDMLQSNYKINMSEYFIIKDTGINIIYDNNIINTIISNTKNTIYPHGIESIRDDIISNKLNLKYQSQKPFFTYKNIPLILPYKAIHNDIVIHSRCGGGDGSIFLINNIYFHKLIKTFIIDKLKLLENNYLCIQVRNTDIKSNYIDLYNKNKKYIHSFNKIYLCTDDKKVYNYFISKKLNIYCFTSFPSNNCRNLHTSNIDSEIKIKDLFVDIFLATSSKNILSNSKGGFINLLRKCFLKKTIINNKLK